MSSKKSKKSKDKKVSLQEFLATNGSNTGTTQVVVQKVSNWADECDDDDDRPTRHEVIELPTAPRSARVFDDDLISYNGPFLAKVSNLPFDTNDAEVEEFFIDADIRVKEMRLARDENNDRLRGYGHIEFEAREDLINAIQLPDAVIRNRRVRIELVGDNDGRDKGVRKRYDYSSRDGSNNENTNWRDRKDSSFDAGDNRRENRRGGDYQRPTFQNRHDTNNNNDDMSNWRMGERQLDSPPPERRRGGGGGGGYERRNPRERYERKPIPGEERPVLKLDPRTKPLPVLNFPKEEELERPQRKVSVVNGDAENHNDDEEQESAPPAPKPKPIPNAAVFGDAKPVDTAAREREIEAKLDQERQARVDAEREDRQKLKNVDEPEDVKKDIIVIKTERTRLQEEGGMNWRRHEEPSSEPPRNRDNGRRFNDRRNDDRNRGDNRGDNRYKDNNNRNYNNNRNNDYRGGNRGGPNRGMDNRRDGPRRDGGHEMKREEQPPREIRREKAVRDPEERMPKYKAPSGPDFNISNAYAGLDVEVDAE